MKKLVILSILSLMIASVFGQFKPTILIPRDSIALKKNPYFFTDSKRPYYEDPKTWMDFPKNITTIAQAEAAIKKATDEKDYYKVLQICYLGLFKNDSSRLSSVYSVEFYAYKYNDPWLLYYVTNYLIKYPINNPETKASLVATITYTTALNQKDSKLLYKLANFQRTTNLIEKVTADEIVENANKYDLQNTSSSTSTKTPTSTATPTQTSGQQKHLGKLISGNNTDGYGLKEYTQNDSLVRIGWTYKGIFANGLENGKGVLADKNGKIVYVGQWTNGNLNGYGKYCGVDYVYEGQFVNNKKEGKGSLVYSDSSKYNGQFKNDLKNGFGIYKENNGWRTEGNYINDSLNGFAKNYDSTNFLIFEGNYKGDFWNGKGTLYDKSGVRIDGMFYGDKLNGEYVFTLVDGTKKTVTFKDNEVVENKVDLSSAYKTIFESEWTGYSKSRADMMENGYVVCTEKLYNVNFDKTSFTFTGNIKSTFPFNGYNYSCISNIKGTFYESTQKIVIIATYIVSSDDLPNGMYWTKPTITLNLFTDDSKPNYFILKGQTSNQQYSDELIYYEAYVK